MLDPKIVRNSIEAVAAQTKKRGVALDISRFNSLEEKRKQLQVNMQDLQNERNVRSKEVGIAKASGKNVDEVLKNLKTLSDKLKGVEEQFAATQVEMDDFLARIPNLAHESVPEGKSEEDNQLVRTIGEPPAFAFTAKDHVELGS